MIVELITPLVLATSPVTLDSQKPIYSHESQQVVAMADGSDKAIFGWGSTRTFNSIGQPNDNDND